MRNVLIWLTLFCSAVMADDDAESRKRIYLFFEGRDLYQSQCIHCHGQTGKGDGPWSVDLTANRPRNFRSGVYKFRSTPVGYLPTDEDLYRTIRGGVTGTAMPAFRTLPDAKLEAVVAYIKSFSREWKKPERIGESVELPERPEWMTFLVARQGHVESGNRLFSLYCMACHGTEGKGDGPTALSLKDVWGHDIKPADLSAPHLKSGARSEDLFRTIALGLDGTPMVSFGQTLKEEEIWELVAFVESLKERGS